MDTLAKLQYIFSKIRAVNPEPIEHAGLSEEHIRAAFTAASLDTPDVLFKAYSVSNGVDYLDGFLSFLPLERAMSEYRGYASHKASFPDFQWRPTWIPVLDMNRNVTICIDFGTKEVFGIDLEADRVTCMGRDYETYIDALLLVFSSGNFRYKEESDCIEFDAEYWRDLVVRHDMVGISEIW